MGNSEDDNLNKNPTPSGSIWTNLGLWASPASEQDSFCCWVSHWGQGMSREWLFNPVLVRDLKKLGATKLNDNRCLISRGTPLCIMDPEKITMLPSFGLKKSKHKTPFQFAIILKPCRLIQLAAENELSAFLSFKFFGYHLRSQQELQQV